MQKWITLPFGPRKKERRRERKKEGHNERPVGRPVGVGGYCYAPTMGTKGLARSLVLRRHLCPRDGRDADGHGRLLKGKLFGENPSFNYRFMSVSQGETTASPSGLLSAFHPFLRENETVVVGAAAAFAIVIALFSRSPVIASRVRARACGVMAASFY